MQLFLVGCIVLESLCVLDDRQLQCVYAKLKCHFVDVILGETIPHCYLLLQQLRASNLYMRDTAIGY